MVEEEIERLKVRHGKMTDPETVTGDENVLNLKFTEVNEQGETVEGGIEKDNSLLVKYFSEAVRPQFIGKKKDDSIVVTLGEAFEEKELDWVMSDLGLEKNDPENTQRSFRLLITKVGLIEKAEVNEELFKAVFPAKEIKSEEDFRTEIKNEIQAYWDAQSRVQLQDQLYHLFLDTPMEFPVDFLKRWLKTGGEKEKTEEEVETEFPAFANQLKWTLISERLLDENKFEVSEAEIRDHMKREVMQYFGQMGLGDNVEWLDSYMDRMMQDQKQVDSAYRKIITQKLFEWAADHTNPTVKEVSPEELSGMQHHHQH